jgi:hypothetical protein
MFVLRVCHVIMYVWFNKDNNGTLLMESQWDTVLWLPNLNGKKVF